MNEMRYFDAMIRTCPICGKTFVCRDTKIWAYKRDKMIACSWHCLRSFDAMPEKEQRVIVKAIPKTDGRGHRECATE